MIRSIYWDTVSSLYQHAWTSPPHTCHAVWPSPINADACFENAGFTEFEDTDDQWDSDWRTIVELAIQYLSRFGTPAVRTPIVPVVQNRLLDRVLKGSPKFTNVTLSLTEQLVLTMMDDQFPHAVIDFGNVPDATLVTGDGHPILWIIANADARFFPEDMVKRIADTCKYHRRELNWPHLLPTSVSV